MGETPRQQRRREYRARADVARRMIPLDANAAERFGWWLRIKMHELHIPPTIGMGLVVVLLAPLVVVGLVIASLWLVVSDLAKGVVALFRRARG